MIERTEVGRVRHALRAATAGDHDRVDSLFARFVLADRDDYRAFLRAHARALAPLEAATRPADPRLSRLAADLAAMGDDLPPPLPLDAPQDDDAYRWGMLYALEGSRLGGAYLARSVDPALPRAYLSAAHEKGGWVLFQQALDAAGEAGGDAWIANAACGARMTFAMFERGALAESEASHGG